MNIQILGTKKCAESRKAERFFRERRISYHFRDLTEKNITCGELENIVQSVPVEDLLDREGKQFQKRNMKFMVFNTAEELLGDPLLFKTPIVRNGKRVTIGYEPEIWMEWIKEG